jgi:hypothetical protein
LPSGAIQKLWSMGDRLRRGRSLSVRPSEARIDPAAADAALALLGPDGDVARDLDAVADQLVSTMVSLSWLTTELATDYLERLAKPIASLTPAAGVQLVSRGYAAMMAVEREPVRFAASPGQPPALTPLPPLRRGRPPQDLLTRTVKASRRGFPALRTVPVQVWDGVVVLLTLRVHELSAAGDELLAVEVVDGLARFGWVLRLVDVRYGLEPEGPPR